MKTIVNHSVFVSWFLFERFNRLHRTLAYLLRFINNSRLTTKCLTGLLTVDELNHSLLVLIKLSQQDSFVDERT